MTSAPCPGVVDLLAQPLLAEGSVYERLRRHPDVPFDAQIGTGALVLPTREPVEGMSLDALRAGLGPAWPFEHFGEFLDAIESRDSRDARNVAPPMPSARVASGAGTAPSGNSPSASQRPLVAPR